MAQTPLDRPVVRLLGPVEVSSDSGSISVGGPKARAVLAMLALADGRPVAVERIIDGVWGEHAPGHARNTLQVHISGIRKGLTSALGPSGEVWALLAAGGGYRLRLPAQAADVAVFERLIAEADVALMHGSYPEARALASRALDLWSGQPLAGLEETPFVAAEAARLVDQLLVAHELAADSGLALGRDREVAADLERVLAEHTFCEPLWRRQMLAFYRSGRQAEALGAYERVRRILAEELGLDPGPDLVALQQAILRQDPALFDTAATTAEQPDGAASATSSGGAGTLPWYGNPLVGPDADVDALTHALGEERARLITLLGPGGTGKTRLAVEVAGRLVTSYDGAVTFVDTAAAEGPDDLLGECRRVIGGRDSGDPLQAFAEVLGDRSSLLVLDNFEYLATTCGATLNAMLEACRRLQVLATSRIAVDIDVEARYQLQPLDIVHATTVFVDRARKVVRGFRLDADSEAAVVAVCERLDRLPLAIELAAARLKLLPVQALRDHLQTEALSLAGGPRDAHRQRTLRATVQWSVSLLSDPAASALAAPSAFEGGFTISAAEAALGGDSVTTLETLAELVDNSLLVGPTTEEVITSRSAPRFRLLQTIRDFAAERLESDGRADEVRRRIADHFLRRCPDPERVSSAADPVVDDLGPEVANLRSSINWLTANDPVAAARLVGGTFRTLISMGEVRVLIEMTRQLVGHTQLDEVANARMGALFGAAVYNGDESAAAVMLLDEPLRILRARGDASYARVVGSVYLCAALADLGRHGEARPVADEMLEFAQETGREAWVSLALHGAAYAARAAGDSERAVVLAQASVEAAVRVGDSGAEVIRRSALARCLLAVGRPEEALAAVERVSELASGSHVRVAEIEISGARGAVLVALGRREEAADVFIECLLEAAKIGIRAELGWAALALATQHPQAAARLLGAVLDDGDVDVMPPAELAGDDLEWLQTHYVTDVELGRREGWPAVAQHLVSLGRRPPSSVA